jgi:hypothetical protein
MDTIRAPATDCDALPLIMSLGEKWNLLQNL